MTLCIFKTQGEVKKKERKKKGKQTAFLVLFYFYPPNSYYYAYSAFLSTNPFDEHILGTCTFPKDTLTNPLISGQPALPFEP